MSTIDVFPLSIGESLAVDLIALGVPPRRAKTWARAGGAQQPHLYRAMGEGTGVTFLWEVHRRGTGQLRIVDWVTTGDEPSTALDSLVGAVIDAAQGSALPLVKAESVSEDHALEAALQHRGFRRLPPPVTGADGLTGWVLWLQEPPAAEIPAYLRQRTDFTCGPVSLLMGFSARNQRLDDSLATEMAIWREATYVLGTDPYGLAAASARRGITPEVWVTSGDLLLVEQTAGSLTDPAVRRQVHELNVQAAKEQGADIRVGEFSVADLYATVAGGRPVLLLIDEDTLNAEVCAHWVLVWGVLGDSFLLHDPWTDAELGESWVETSTMPVSPADLWAMATWGTEQVRAAVVL